MSDLISSPLTIILLSIVVALAIYWIGGSLKAKGEPSEGKEEAYACGEELPAAKSKVNILSFFMYAFYFLIFDILAFILVTAYGTAGIYTILYVGIALIAVIVLPRLKAED